MKNLRTLVCTLYLYCLLNPAVAGELSRFETELLQTQLVAAKSALNLSPEQEVAFNEVLQSAAKQRHQTLKKYNISMADENKAKLKLREKRALLEDMQTHRNNLEEQLEDVLTEEQLSLFQSMREDNQKMFQQRLRNKLN